jgi:hypothetical protein
VICVRRPQSSVRVRRNSSVSVSTRIVSSIVFDRANRGLLTEASATKEAGASLATGTKRRSAEHLRPSADERCDKAERRTGLVWWMEERVLAMPG